MKSVSIKVISQENIETGKFSENVPVSMFYGTILPTKDFNEKKKILKNQEHHYLIDKLKEVPLPCTNDFFTISLGYYYDPVIVLARRIKQ